ncbi:CorA metal ion transporter [Coemansia sp. RSA 2336]|nr:CorA metal ion transporter [Coemansia sp. RSA 2336]
MRLAKDLFFDTRYASEQLVSSSHLHPHYPLSQSMLEANRRLIDSQSPHAWGTEWDLVSQSSAGVRSSLVDTSSWFLQHRQYVRSRIQSIAATGRDSHYCNSFFADSELVPSYSSTNSSIRNGKAGAIDIECSISVDDASVDGILAANTDEMPAADSSQSETIESTAPVLSSDDMLDPRDSSVLWIQHNAKPAMSQCSPHWDSTFNIEKAPSQVMFFSSQTGPIYAPSLHELAASGVDLEGWTRQRANSPMTSSKPCFWLDVGSITLDELHHLGRLVGLHPLTMEDIETKSSSRDKIDIFQDYVFIVVRSAVQRRRGRWQNHYKYCRANSSIRPVSSKENSRYSMADYSMASSDYTLHGDCKASRDNEQLLMVLKDDFIVTFHTGCHQNETARVLQRLSGIAAAAASVQDHLAASSSAEFDTDELAELADYPAYIAYALLDEVTDQMLPEITKIEDKVDAIDELVLLLTHAEHESVLQQMGEQRRHILRVWQWAQPKSEVVAKLKRVLTSSRPGRSRQKLASSRLAQEVVQYLSDVQEHLLAAIDACSRAETVLARSHSNYLAKISLELSRAQVDSNSTTERWTMLGTIVVPINIVTSFLGVNLKVPGQDRDDTLNFFVVLACMLIYTAITLAFWRWRRIV